MQENRVVRLEGGINSKVLLVRDKKGQRIVKKYNGINKRDSENRLAREAYYLKKANEAKLTNIPRLIEENRERVYLEIEFIDGVKPKEMTLDIIKELSKTTKEISDRLDVNGYKHEAKGWLEDISKYALDIIRRTEKLISLEEENSKETRIWVREVLIPEAQDELKKAKVKSQEPQWAPKNRNIVISQSDVGLHNMLIKDKQINFIDFEYAGRDDIAKLASDIANQPENNWASPGLEKIMDIFEKDFANKDLWKERCKDIDKLTRLKWCLIKLWTARKEIDQKRILEEVKKYYQR